MDQLTKPWSLMSSGIIESTQVDRPTLDQLTQPFPPTPSLSQLPPPQLTKFPSLSLLSSASPLITKTTPSPPSLSPPLPVSSPPLSFLSRAQRRRQKRSRSTSLKPTETKERKEKKVRFSFPASAQLKKDLKKDKSDLKEAVRQRPVERQTIKLTAQALIGKDHVLIKRSLLKPLDIIFPQDFYQLVNSRFISAAQGAKPNNRTELDKRNEHLAKLRKNICRQVNKELKDHLPGTPKGTISHILHWKDYFHSSAPSSQRVSLTTLAQSSHSISIFLDRSDQHRSYDAVIDSIIKQFGIKYLLQYIQTHFAIPHIPPALEKAQARIEELIQKEIKTFLNFSVCFVPLFSLVGWGDKKEMAKKSRIILIFIKMSELLSN